MHVARTNWVLAFTLGLLSCAAFAQQAGSTLRGQVTDTTGAVIPGAAVTVKGVGVTKNVSTGPDGTFVVDGLPPGKYTVRATSTGFAPYENRAVDVGPRAKPLGIALNLPVAKQEVTVQGGPGVKLSTEADNNASALILRGEDLDALPDDPDDLAADLQALAGPSAGPNGGQIYVDGFSGARLPPKESIREIRINQNPFAAEYDRLGFGRIEILTKPGSDKFHGQSFFSFGDDYFNTRNPYAPNKASFQQRMYGGSLGGPINKRASFYLDFERREIDDNAIIHATTLDSLLNPVAFSQAVLTPDRRTSLSPRIDYQLSTNHTLVMKYSFFRYGQDNAGVGEFSLLSRGYNSLATGHTFQATETAVLSHRAVNETRFQFIRSNTALLGDNTLPGINVLQSFTGGGAQIGHAYNLQNRWELQNYTSVQMGPHALKFGGRLRASTQDSNSPSNFSGTFVFSGGPGPVLDSNNQIVLDSSGNPVMTQLTSLEQYRRTLLFQQQGLSVAQIRALYGGGPSQFSITGGNPLASVTQADVGAFLQDDWRVRSNLTLSMGLRYETQTNIHDWRDLGPRIGFAWAPGASTGRSSKTVLRGGFGMFYYRFDDDLTLNATRFNGISEHQYILQYPAFFPAVPSIDSLQAAGRPQTIYQIASNLRAPYIMQSAIGIERQLPFNTTVATTFTNSHAQHLLLTRNINAPLPGSGLQPYGAAAGNIYQYESAGLLNQNQWITNVTSRVNRNTTLFAYYVLNYAKSNTDGVGTMPANQYDLRDEYGRSSLDTRHRFVLGGSLVAWKAVRLSPFVIVHSGSPYNVTIGRDLSGDSVFTDRPALVVNPPSLLDPSRYRVTPIGVFDMAPGPGEAIIPRNFAEGPGYVSINLRLSRTWGFGPGRNGNYDMSDSGGSHHDHGSRGGSSGMRMGSGGGGFHSIFGSGGTEKRYNLTLSVSARNILNHTNAGNPIGNLTSPLFGESIATANSFGPDRAQAGNRRMEFQLRFSF